MKPASTAALEAPMAASSLSANCSIRVKFSFEPRPLPPETIRSAVVSSGRSDSDSWSEINSELDPGIEDEIVSTEAEPPSPECSKAVALTVITMVSSEVSTVAITFPA